MGLRPEQAEIANYTGGRLAVSAVPGSGKTYTLAALVTNLLQRGLVPDHAEVLVVTFTNSAVDTIRNRIRLMLRDQKLTDAGYRVLTLHGLANLIVRERSDLAGVSPDFRMDDELSGRRTMPDATQWFQLQHPEFWRSFIPTDVSAQQRADAEKRWNDATARIGTEVTRLAKNKMLTPQALIERVQQAYPDDVTGAGNDRINFTNTRSVISPFLKIGVAIYQRYEQILTLGGRLDYDDLIWRAIIALRNNDAYRASLGARWHYVLEDEAQDSTPLQEQILSMLTQDHSNWVRVGDPNQAIMTTFTASDVKFFRDFLTRADVRKLPLSVSGRSAQRIIDMANRLADWVATQHPEPAVRATAMSNIVRIAPTGADDPQPNPPDAAAHVWIEKLTDEEQEVIQVARGAVRFVRAHPDQTCAILTPTNWFGQSIVQELESQTRQDLPRVLYQDQLRNTLKVRAVAQLLARAVAFCGSPTNTNALSALRDAMVAVGALPMERTQSDRVGILLRSAKPERLLFPSPAEEPALPPNVDVSAVEQRQLDDLSAYAAKWLRASVLPIDQLVLTIAQDTLTRDNDLAVAHNMAVSLRRMMATYPEMQLPELATELGEIANNKHKYMSDSLLESGFEPQPGVITVTTMHKAKGLEWDRVYLTCVDQVEFPHDVEGQYRGEQWFLNGHDPSTEARKELEALVDGVHPLPAGIALMNNAREEYIAERMRLLYVGITRARRELVITHSRDRRGQTNELALAVQETRV